MLGILYDKNHPLPPGTAFDEYRTEDFNRIKALGFPKPIFLISFNTPSRAISTTLAHFHEVCLFFF